MIQRDFYGAIRINTLSPSEQKMVHNLVNQAGTRTDEHGSWEFGAEFDKKGRGSALNWDLYGRGRDIHTRRFLIVIQIRQWEKRRKNGFANVRKNYFLVGRNEDGSVFSHPVESRVIHAAIKADRDVVQAVQSWIFGSDYSKVVRHGDLVFVPCRPSGEYIANVAVIIEESHVVHGRGMRENGILYVLDPFAHHIPETHPDVEAIGWHKVMIARRSSYWTFARPSKD